jgi:hypothetical protein
MLVFYHKIKNWEIRNRGEGLFKYPEGHYRMLRCKAREYRGVRPTFS